MSQTGTASGLRTRSLLLEPMVDATVSELERAGVAEKPKVAVADAGYWHHEQMDSAAAGGTRC